MISRLFKPRKKPDAPTAPAVPDGTAVWAIGDVHGRLDLLKPLLDAVLADAAATRADRKVVIFLGDYVDRGPESRGVIQHLTDLPRDTEVEWRFLMGNHERTMLDFLVDPSAGVKWCEYGGIETLQSYGLRLPQMRHKPEVWVRLSADLDHRLTSAERAFLEALELSVEIGDYFFSHAGARPGQPLSRQSPEDLMWIRRSFLDSPVGFERVVVHGHTPTAEVHYDHRRLGVDTKAYESGVLTALRLIGQDRALIQTRMVSAATEGAERPIEVVHRALPDSIRQPIPA